MQDMLTGIPDGSLPDTLASIVKASYLEKLEVLKILCQKIAFVAQGKRERTLAIN